MQKTYTNTQWKTRDTQVTWNFNAAQSFRGLLRKVSENLCMHLSFILLMCLPSLLICLLIHTLFPRSQSHHLPSSYSESFFFFSPGFHLPFASLSSPSSFLLGKYVFRPSVWMQVLLHFTLPTTRRMFSLRTWTTFPLSLPEPRVARLECPLFHCFRVRSDPRSPASRLPVEPEKQDNERREREKRIEDSALLLIKISDT